MTRCVSINPEPITEIPFLNAGRGPGGFYEDRLPILDAVVHCLPDGMSGIIATADLQGRERFQDSPNGVPRLLGEALPSRLAVKTLPGVGLDVGSVGVFLAGDLYTVPALDRRGGSGDVRAVWEAFGDGFAWVIGVAVTMTHSVRTQSCSAISEASALSRQRPCECRRTQNRRARGHHRQSQTSTSPF